MSRSTHLISLLLALCAAQGVAPQSLNSWNAWKTFKGFARTVNEVPDPGVSVQLAVRKDGSRSLIFLRQVVESSNDWLEPTGGVVWEFRFRPSSEPRRRIEFWSFGYETFEAFVDAVEQDAGVGRLFAKEAGRARLYWRKA